MTNLIQKLTMIFTNPVKIWNKIELYFINFFINRHTSVYYKGIEIYKIINFGNITKMRADSFEIKEPETICWINSFSENDRLLDIGANVGIYSLYAAYNNINVLAIEPDALNFSLLNLNIKNNFFNNKITAYPYSINDISKVSTLNMVDYSWGGAMSSFDRELDWRGNSITPNFTQGSPGITIDKLVAETNFFPDHIKIDVDGNELLVLEGAQKTLSNKSIKSILIELYEDHDEYEDCLKIIKKNGFTLKEKTHSYIYDQDDLRTDNYIFIKKL